MVEKAAGAAAPFFKIAPEIFLWITRGYRGEEEESIVFTIVFLCTEDKNMNQQLYNEAVHSSVLSKQLISELQESMNYSSISFINWSVEVLGIIKTRLERGDRITDEVSGITYTTQSFREFVKENFSSYIESQVFGKPGKGEKIYFSLESFDGGYNLVMADSGENKTFEWISSLSRRFSLVQMIATGIVYVKDVRRDSYQPFISEHGKYCRYDKERGQIVEIP